jgi:AcrR family transcriptional regulator
MASRNDTRQALLEAAEQLFSHHGYAAVGIREIAAQAGANLAAIKYHFGSKRALYLEVVSHAMDRRVTAAAWDAIASPPRGRRQAAALLATFVRSLLQQLLTNQGLNSCSRLMLQEAMRPSEAMEAVVEHFVRPHEQRLRALLAAVAPDAAPGLLTLASRGLMGQVLYYVIFRPFLERAEGARLFRRTSVQATADHASSCTLRSLGCSPALVAGALRAAARASLPRSSPKPSP